MNTDFNNSGSHAGDFISESAVRGALRRRPRARSTTTAYAAADHRTDSAARTDDASPRAGGSRRLRRWSVAELIANAVPRPTKGGVAH